MRLIPHGRCTHAFSLLAFMKGDHWLLGLTRTNCQKRIWQLSSKQSLGFMNLMMKL